MASLVLASTSPYRRILLERLGLPFIVAKPDTDERPLRRESAQDLVKRLAEAKARAVAKQHPGAIIIGADQVASLDDQILGKPGSHARAKAQLQSASGRQVDFYTGLCVFNSAIDTCHVEVIPYAVQFRELNDQQIDNYLQREQPYDCAGSFKSEGLGTALFAKHQGEDPTALIGLPLIRLVALLEREGVAVLG